MSRAAVLVSTGLAVLSAGCKAESVGVEVPKGGPGAISMEDLRRDAFLFEAQRADRAPGTARPASAWQALADRLGQMKAVPGFGRAYRGSGSTPVVCGRKDGRSDRAVVVAVEDRTEAPGASTAALAMVVSLAKAWDVRRPPPKTLLFCGWSGEDGHAAFVAAPPVSPDSVDAIWMVGGPARPWPGAPAAEVLELDLEGTAEALDYEAVHRRTVAIEGTVRAGVSASP